MIELVLEGGRYVPPEALSETESGDGLPARQPTSASGSEPSRVTANERPRGASRLTERQSMIWRLLAEGRSNKEIARRLAIAEGTVKSQVKSIYRKLGVRNRTQAALLAVGEVEEDEPPEAA